MLRAGKDPGRNNLLHPANRLRCFPRRNMTRFGLMLGFLSNLRVIERPFAPLDPQSCTGRDSECLEGRSSCSVLNLHLELRQGHFHSFQRQQTKSAHRRLRPDKLGAPAKIERKQIYSG